MSAWLPGSGINVETMLVLNNYKNLIWRGENTKNVSEDTIIQWTGIGVVSSTIFKNFKILRANFLFRNYCGDTLILKE